MTLTVSANGAEIPAIGFGTWQLRERQCTEMVAAALEAGYRHVDTAAVYENEAAVGEALRGHITPREDVFVTTKVWYTELGGDDFRRAAEASLKRLDVGPVDLLLIHWPSPETPLAEQIGNLCRARREGLARHIGVSNFPSAMVDEAVSHADEPLVCNQVEYHPMLDQSAVHAACRRHGLAMTAYSPIGRASFFDEPAIAEIAAAKERTPAQVILRWHIQQPGVVAIPRTSNPERARENIDIEDFALTPEEMGRISQLARPDGRMVDPAWAPRWDAA